MGRVEKSSEMKFRGRIENFLSWLAMILNFLDSLVGDCWFWYICAALEDESFLCWFSSGIGLAVATLFLFVPLFFGPIALITMVLSAFYSLSIS